MFNGWIGVGPTHLFTHIPCVSQMPLMKILDIGPTWRKATVISRRTKFAETVISDIMALLASYDNCYVLTFVVSMTLACTTHILSRRDNSFPLNQKYLKTINALKAVHIMLI